MIRSISRRFNENLTNDKLSRIPSDDIRRLIFKYVSDFGYIKGGYGYHNNNGTSYRGSPTVAEIARILDSENYSDYLAPDTDEINNWVNNLQPEGQFADFQRKIKDVWPKRVFVRDDFPILCAAVASFNREKEYQERQRARQERAAKHQQAVEADSNRWAGNVGDEIEFVVKEAKIVTYIRPNYYNASDYPLWKITDVNGLVYSWGDTSCEAEVVAGSKIKAKIRRLNEYKGIKETQIWKVKIEGPKVRGFFSQD